MKWRTCAMKAHGHCSKLQPWCRVKNQCKCDKGRHAKVETVKEALASLHTWRPLVFKPHLLQGPVQQGHRHPRRGGDSRVMCARVGTKPLG